MIGATTENPSFHVNSALLSRCRVIVLEKLSTAELMTILENAVKALEGVVCEDEDVRPLNNGSDR
jgi:putative ATPase